MRGRVVRISQIEEQVKFGRGTLIIERGFPKGPIRHWWTPDNIYELSPYPLGSPVNPFESSPFVEAIDWCRGRYTDVLKGTAALIEDRSVTPMIAMSADRLRRFEIPIRGY